MATVENSGEQIELALESGDFAKAKALLQSLVDEYYLTGQSQLSDSEFDVLQQNYVEMTGDVDFLNNSVSKDAMKVAKIREAVINYENMCCWLDKSPSTEDTYKWLASRKKSLNKDSLDIVASLKYDGFSVTIEYDFSGRPIYAVTRGDGDVGMDYSHFFANDPKHYSASTIKDIVSKYNVLDCLGFAVKYEACITEENLAALNEIRVAEGNEPYKNRRNTVPALFRQSGGERFRKYVSLIPIDVDFKDQDFLNRLSKIERLSIITDLLNTANDVIVKDDLFFQDSFQFNNYQISNENDIAAIYTQYEAYRAASPYMIDGIVLECNQPEDVRNLGGFSDHPNHVLGWKFDVYIAHTIVTGYNFDYGRTGRRTPVIQFEPVNIYGNTYVKASISNLIRFDALKLGIGSHITFSLRGDVLGYIENDPNFDDSNIEPFGLPDDIERFSYRTIVNENGEKVEQRVFAFSQPRLAGVLERFFVKAGLRNVKTKTFDIIEEGLDVHYGVKLSYIEDFFNALFTYDFTVFNNFGESRDAELRSLLKKKNKKGWESWEILSGLNITSIGNSVAKAFLENLDGTLLDFSTMLISTETDDEYGKIFNELCDKYENISLIGSKRIEYIMDGIFQNYNTIVALYDLLNVKDTKAVQHTGESYTLVVTGALNLYEDRNTDFKAAIEALGHRLVNKISGKTSYLVTNTPDSGTVKNREAIEKKVPIVTELEICEILGLTPPVNSKNVDVSTIESTNSIDDFL